MKSKIIDFLKYINRFGIYNGFILFLKIKMNRAENIYVPGIQYPICLRPDTTDISAFKHVFLRLEYNFKTNIDPKVIIDGGANIGLSAIYFKNRFPNATIIAVEPDKGNFTLLKKNLSAYENIHLKHSGLWNKKVSANVIDKYNNGEWGMAIEESSSLTNDVITTVTIGELIEEFKINKIDLLKLDIEAAEKILFKDNYSNWLRKRK